MTDVGAQAPPEPSAPILDIFASRQGEGLCVGDPQIFVRFGGCNLVCDYCDTPESIPAHSGQPQSLAQVLGRLAGLRDACGSGTVSLTGGEPLLHVKFLERLIPALRTAGWRVYLETNGTLPQALAKIIHGCDWIAMDFKPASAIGRDVWEAHRWFLEMGGNKIFVKMVLTEHTTDSELSRAVALIRRVRSTIPLVLQPATPWGGTASVPLARLASWWRQATAQLSDVRILPQVHRWWGLP